MKTTQLLISAICTLLFCSCAAVVPPELANAREAYRRASTGSAGQVAPAEVHVANLALAKAENAFQRDPESFQTRDLAYVAQRKAQLAEATASIILVQESQARSNAEFSQTQGQIVANTKQDLAQTQNALLASEKNGDVTQAKLSAEKQARLDAERRAAIAQAALAKLAAVKDEPRGMVITLSGSVLFASDQSTLLPAAQSRLDQVAEVLLTSSEKTLTIEGHTDSQGSDGYNISLSQRRADAVRSYLMQKGYNGSLIQANGIGEVRPVSDNGNAEGRANNRRVEIVVNRELISSNQQ